jgi:hypothetical protein
LGFACSSAKPATWTPEVNEAIIPAAKKAGGSALLEHYHSIAGDSFSNADCAPFRDLAPEPWSQVEAPLQAA